MWLAATRAMTQDFCLAATLFAYGQTASGKTHTIMGDKDEPGIIPLALSGIFHYMDTQVWLLLQCFEVYSYNILVMVCFLQSGHREFILRCSYLEIYNEVSLTSSYLLSWVCMGSSYKLYVCFQGLTDLLDVHPGAKTLTMREDRQVWLYTYTQVAVL